MVLFLPDRNLHPELSKGRVGDIFRGFQGVASLFRETLSVTFAAKKKGEYEIINGEHSLDVLSDPGPHEETELYRLREYRLRLMAEDQFFANKTQGPYMPRGYPPSRLKALMPPAPVAY